MKKKQAKKTLKKEKPPGLPSQLSYHIFIKKNKPRRRKKNLQVSALNENKTLKKNLLVFALNEKIEN